MINQNILEDQQQNYDQYPSLQNSKKDMEQKDGDITRDMNMLQINGSINEEDMQINTILKNLKSRLNALDNLIYTKENEKEGIIQDINILTQRMKALTKSVQIKKALYENYERTLNEAETAFSKITESTKTLLTVVKKECVQLNKAQSFKEKKPDNF